jgi:hypothetical protein
MGLKIADRSEDKAGSHNAIVAQLPDDLLSAEPAWITTEVAMTGFGPSATTKLWLRREARIPGAVLCGRSGR